MTFLAGILARIVGPRILGAIPWRLLAVLFLAAGVASLFWAADNHGKRVQRTTDAAVIAGLRANLATVKSAQLAMNKAAAANKARVETVQTTTSGKDNHATLNDLADVRSQYAAYRRLHPATAQGVAGPCRVPGVPESSAVAADAAGAAAAQPSADVVGIAEEGDVYRAQVIGWQRWYADQAAISRTPVTPEP